MSADRSRSIVVTLEESPDIDAQVTDWLATEQADVVFSVAEMCNPARDAGKIEYVLALDGLPETSLSRLLGDLCLTPAVPPFTSFR